MADKLKIYACSGIGDAEQQRGYATFWTDGTDPIANTQAVNRLLAMINVRYAEYKHLHKLSVAQRIALLNDIDLLTVCLEAAKRFKDDNEKLRNAGLIIGAMQAAGDFDYDEQNEEKRSQHLETLIDKAVSDFESTVGLEEADPEFAAWWDAEIMPYNKVGLSEQAQDATKKALRKAAKGVGKADEAWKENEDISQYLTNAGEYFLYLYFTENELNSLPKKFKQKRKYQEGIYNYCKAYFVPVYGTEADMQDIIYTGILQQFNDTPENICKTIAKSKQEPVGSITVAAVLGAAEIVAIITAAISAVVAIVKLICDTIYKSNVAKYAALNEAAVENGVPDPEDFDGLDINTNTSISTSGNGIKKYLPYILGGAVLLAILKR